MPLLSTVRKRMDLHEPAPTHATLHGRSATRSHPAAVEAGQDRSPLGQEGRAAKGGGEERPKAVEGERHWGLDHDETPQSITNPLPTGRVPTLLFGPVASDCVPNRPLSRTGP